jgi:hypothetical protein
MSEITPGLRATLQPCLVISQQRTSPVFARYGDVTPVHSHETLYFRGATIR